MTSEQKEIRPARNERVLRVRVSTKWLLELVLLAVGLLLLTFYGVAMLDRYLGSEVAIQGFQAQDEPTSRRVTTQDGRMDFSLWSEKRIKGYLDSLAVLKKEPMGVLAVSRLKIKAPVFAGTDELVLNRGLGWIPGTAKPGEAGNSGIAGHRDGFFRALKDIEVGDSVDLQTHQAKLKFRVDEIKIVGPEDVGVLRPRGTDALTLVTCYPFYFVGDAPRRFIVHAKLEQRVAIQSTENSGAPVHEAAKRMDIGAIQ